MTNHCFISYSTADALDFAHKLANELEGGEDRFIPVWLDKRDIDPARDWDEQIAEGIRSCKCMLFVMTADSTMPNSMCKNEWNWALRYKKPVVPLRLHGNAEQPFGLGNRQWIDFTGEFKAGLAKLRKFIQRMDEPEGILEALKDRLMDAERGLRRAKPEDEARIKAEMDDLKAQIVRQAEIVRDPQAAQAQTQKNIETGLERERQPEKPITKSQSTKFINPPPGIAPTYFQDRLLETEQVIHFLQNDAQRMMTVAGRGGVGKTAMVCRLLKHLESGELPDGKGKLSVEGIVYLSETGTRRVNFPHLFADLSKLLPEESAQQLEALYKDPQTSVDAKMHALLEAFLPDGQIVLLLDNFESVVEAETQKLKDGELDEALRAVLHAPHHAVKVLITTRVAPRELNLLEPARQRLLTLDEGLDSPYAEQILRQMDEDGKLGLKTAPEELLKRAKERTLGYPRALEALFAILSSDRYTTLEELLNQPTPENVVEALVGEAFSRLDPTAQKVMQALAIYNCPVTPAAVDYLLQPHLPGVDSAPVLQRLVNMHFVRNERWKFYLHPVDRDFAYALLLEGDEITLDNPAEQAQLYKQFGMQSPRKERNDFTKIGLTDRAASYFAQARKPFAEWKKLDDLAAQLTEFDLHCAARDFDTAASVLAEIDGKYLLVWGHYRLMIQMHERLVGKVNDIFLRMTNFAGLGLAYRNIGEIHKSIMYFEKGIPAAREAQNSHAEGVFLGNLGNVYAISGETRKAIEFHEHAMRIAHENDNMREEGIWLGNIGNRYIELGDVNKALEYYEQALVIAKRFDDLRSEENFLICIGYSYSYLGEYLKAIELQEQALAICRKIGDQRNLGYGLNSLGEIYIDLNKIYHSIKNFQEAIVVSDEINFTIIQSSARYGEAQAHLLLNELSVAHKIIEEAAQYDVPQNNHNVSILHGIIALRQGDEIAARQAFTRTSAQADEILAKTPDYYEALDAKGLALCGLAIVGAGLPGQTDNLSGTDTRQDMKNAGPERPAPTIIAEAIETFRKARKIAPHAGVVKSVLRLFDELAKCDPEGMLKDVRAVIAGI